MSDGLNRWQGIGHLGQDPELRVTPGGSAILKLSMACNDSYLDRNNVRQETVEWVRVTVFGRRAEALAKILQKGDRIYVEGKLHTSSYEKQGIKCYSTEVNAQDIILCGGKREGGGGASEGRQERRRAQAPAQDFGPDAGSPPPADDDIPF